MGEETTTLRFEPVCAAMLRDGVAVRFRAPGTSMRPTIRDGDTLVVEPVEASQVRWGDVVVAGETCVRAHRVVRVPDVDGEIFLLRGDSMTACDAPEPSGRILGRVVCVEREGRRFPVRGPGVFFRLLFRRQAFGVLRQLALVRAGLSRWSAVTRGAGRVAGTARERAGSPDPVHARGSQGGSR